MNKKFQVYPVQEIAGGCIASVESLVQAGFPSPADDYLETPLNLHELVVKNPPSTFFVRVAGDSMIGARIEPDDILVVDRSLEPVTGRIIVAVVNGEFTVKRLKIVDGVMRLEAENPAYPDIAIPEGSDFQVWGVVTYVVHKA
jgi:DNA polymerase V